MYDTEFGSRGMVFRPASSCEEKRVLARPHSRREKIKMIGSIWCNIADAGVGKQG